MPIHHQEIMLYSVEEIAQTTNIPLDQIRQFLEKGDFQDVTRLRETIYIPQQALSLFFDQCLAYLGVSPSYYDLPPELKNTATPWATTLVNMYREPFAYGTSLSPAQGQFLRDFVSNVCPETIVEIGCFIGVSTIWMASGLEHLRGNGLIHAIDLFYEIMPCFSYRCGYLQHTLQFAQQAASAAQLAHRIRFHQINSYEAGQCVEELVSQPIDLLYIDGDHSIQGCMTDFALFSPYVAAEGYIILHDIYPEVCGYDGPRYLLEQVIKKSSAFDVIELRTSPRNYGMAIIQKHAIKGLAWPNLSIELIRTKVRLSKTSVWKNMHTTRIGKVVKRIFQ